MNTFHSTPQIARHSFSEALVSVNLIFALLCSIALVSPVAASTYRIRGQWVSTILTANSTPVQILTNEFTILLGTNSYRIDSIDMDSGLPCEARFDGSEVSSILRGFNIQDGQDIPRLNDPAFSGPRDPKIYINNTTELATLELGDRPDHTSRILRCLWIVYAVGRPGMTSSNILSRIAPIANQEEHLGITNHSKIKLRELNAGFLEDADIFCSPDFIAGRSRGGKLLAPFDIGFLCMRLRTSQWTEYDGISFPKVSKIEILVSDYGSTPKPKTPRDTQVYRRIVFTHNSVERVEISIDPLPLIRAKTWLDDYRLLGKYTTSTWITNGSWPPFASYGHPPDFDQLRQREIDRLERLEKLGMLYNRIKSEPVSVSRWIIVICFVISLFLAPVIFIKKIVKNFRR